MLVIRIELWPNGLEKMKASLGTGMITNDGSGSTARGNYYCQFWRRTASSIKRTKVISFRRMVDGPWDLLHQALHQLYIEERLETAKKEVRDGVRTFSKRKRAVRKVLVKSRNKL